MTKIQTALMPASARFRYLGTPSLRVILRRQAALFIVGWILLAGSGIHASELTTVEMGPAVSLSLPDLSGRQRRLEEFAGKVVLVNLWASWCTPCIKEVPSIQRLAEQMHREPFEVVGVNVAEAPRRVQTAVQRLGIEFPVLLDAESLLFERWEAKVLPATYLLDAQGRIRYLKRGPMEWDGAEATEAVRQLLDEARTARQAP
jgi:thiol-disulfide isomerase/thioredoxin